jgi:hypothetical protein
MARSISVKIPTATVLEMVESKVAEYKAQIENYPVLLETYKAERKAYVEKVAKFVADLIANGKQELFEGEWQDIIRLNHRSYGGGVELTIGKNLIGDLADQAPKEPENIDGYNGVKTKLEELEKTLTVLRLTPQEFVTSSTYNSVLSLL